HAVAPDAKAEDVAALRRKPLRPHRDHVLAVLGREDRGARGDPAEDRDLTVAARAFGTPIREHEGARDALVGHPAVEHALSLERAQVVEGRAGSEAEALGDLTNRGRGAVPVRESPHEAQDLALALRHVSQGILQLTGNGRLMGTSPDICGRLLNSIIVNTR